MVWSQRFRDLWVSIKIFGKLGCPCSRLLHYDVAVVSTYKYLIWQTSSCFLAPPFLCIIIQIYFDFFFSSNCGCSLLGIGLRYIVALVIKFYFSLVQPCVRSRCSVELKYQLVLLLLDMVCIGLCIVVKLKASTYVMFFLITCHWCVVRKS